MSDQLAKGTKVLSRNGKRIEKNHVRQIKSLSMMLLSFCDAVLRNTLIENGRRRSDEREITSSDRGDLCSPRLTVTTGAAGTLDEACPKVRPGGKGVSLLAVKGV